MEVVILVPPEPPTTILTWLFLLKMMVGHMEDSGLLPVKKNVADVYDGKVERNMSAVTVTFGLMRIR